MTRGDRARDSIRRSMSQIQRNEADQFLPQISDAGPLLAKVRIDRLVHHAEVLTLTSDAPRTRAPGELLAQRLRRLSIVMVFDHELTDTSIHLVRNLRWQSV